MVPNYVYVAYQDYSGNAFLGFVDPDTNKPVASVPVGTTPPNLYPPLKVGVNPEGTRVYVSNSHLKTLFVINTVNPGIMTTIDLSSMKTSYPVEYILVTPDSLYVYLGYLNNTVAVVDAVSNQLLYSLDVSNGVTGMTTGAGHVFIATSGFGDATLQMIVDATPIGSQTITRNIFKHVSDLYGYPWPYGGPSQLAIVKGMGGDQIQSMNPLIIPDNGGSNNNGVGIYYSLVSNLTDSQVLTGPDIISPTVPVVLSNNTRYVTQTDGTYETPLPVLRMNGNQVIENLTPNISAQNCIAVSPDEKWVCVTFGDQFESSQGLVIYPVVPVGTSTPPGKVISFAQIQNGLAITSDSKYAYTLASDTRHFLNSVVLSTQTRRQQLFMGIIHSFVASYTPYTM